MLCECTLGQPLTCGDLPQLPSALVAWPLLSALPDRYSLHMLLLRYLRRFSVTNLFDILSRTVVGQLWVQNLLDCKFLNILNTSHMEYRYALVWNGCVWRRGNQPALGALVQFGWVGEWQVVKVGWYNSIDEEETKYYTVQHAGVAGGGVVFGHKQPWDRDLEC